MLTARGKTLRVGIDGTPILVAQRTGMERYACALITELSCQYSKLNDMELSVYLHSGNPYSSATYLHDAVAVLRGGGMPYRIHTQRRGYGGALAAYAAIDQLSLLHMLPLERPRVRPCPYILTIHDVKCVGLGEEGNRIERAELSKHEIEVIKGAAGLITVSNSTAQDLANVFGDGLKVPVAAIHHGVDQQYFTGTGSADAIRAKYGLQRYIFFVGTLQYRKNLPRLIAAFSRVKREYSIPHKLVLAGRDGWGAEFVYSAVKDYNIESDVLILGYVPESDLPGLYAGADLFAYPSLHEGFGIPLLEAMASGTVVLTSSLYSIPEVAGDAVVYANALDVEDLASALWRALSDQSLRSDLIAKGKARARLFTWSQMADNTVSFYRRFANGN